MKRLYILVLVLSSVFFGCNKKIDSPEQGAFLAQEEIGAYVDGVAVFVYDDAVHQLAYDPTSMQYTRIQSDDQTKYFQVSYLDKLSSGVGQSVTVEVFSRGISISEGSYDVVVKKRSSDLVWLWSTDKNVGFIMK